jgi:hypothetical protein
VGRCRGRLCGYASYIHAATVPEEIEGQQQQEEQQQQQQQQQQQEQE